MLSRLYVVCDADICARSGWTLPDFAAACMDGGATLLQLRAKRASSRDFLAAAEAVVARAAGGVAVIINDRADIARLSAAGGVHVGQDDLAPSQVRTIVGPDAVVGLSTHTDEQLASAAGEPVNYLAIGPVFGSTTKDTGFGAVGLAMVTRAAALAGPIPVVAIGGITLDTAGQVIAAGATSVSVISDILASGDPSARVRAYLDRLSCV